MENRNPEIRNPQSIIPPDPESAAREAWRAFAALGPAMETILRELDDLYCENPFCENPYTMARNCGRVEVCQYVARRLAWSQETPQPLQEQAQV